MKISHLICSLALALTASAAADAVNVYGRGQGFDNFGNTQFACNQAYAAADQDMNYQCSSYRGVVTARRYGNCSCFAAGGSPYAVNCVADTQGICQFQECRERDTSIVGRGVGGTTRGDRQAACEKAWDRADVEAASSCSMQRGFVVNSQRGSCTCRRKPGSQDDYNCDANVRVTCRVDSCN